MSALEQVAAELRELGYAPQIICPDGFSYTLAVIDYSVKAGRYKKKQFKIGIGFQEDAYPEYPPHWICVDSLPDAKIRKHSSFHHKNAEWTVFSVPPNDFWDTLSSSEKNMKTYLHRHMVRFWDQM